jgi:hypothetical protein
MGKSTDANIRRGRVQDDPLVAGMGTAANPYKVGFGLAILLEGRILVCLI